MTLLDIWLVDPAAVDASHAHAHYAPLLNDDERARWQRFRFERHRHQYLVTRGLARTTLSRYADIAPGNWCFEENAYGKPAIVAGQQPNGEAPLEFNLSHADGLVACAVTRGEPLGVDVEYVERRAETVSIANRFFSDAECRALQALPESRQRDRFFDYWTLKEAYIKARGMGLALPLGAFSFELDAGSDITIAFDQRIDDDPGRWRFTLQCPTTTHRLALCAARSLDAQPRIRWTTP